MRSFRPALLASLLILGWAGAPSFAGPSNDDCLACHSDKDLKSGAGKALFVDETKFKGAIHGQADVGCVDCHADLKTAKDFPHAEKLGMPALDEFGDAALVVGMVMGDKDGFELQLQRLEPGDYRCRVSWIDDRSPSVTDQQPDVVIVERGNEQNFEHAGTTERRPPDVNSRPRRLAGNRAGTLGFGVKESATVDNAVADVFGFNALQLGLPQSDFLQANRIPLRQKAGDCGTVDVLCELAALPFASNSTDLVVLPAT